MRVASTDSHRAGLTRIEAACCVAALALLATLYFLLQPSINHERKSPRTLCISNLKQISLGAMLWANDNGGVLPWNTTNSAAFGNSSTAKLFTAMSNELTIPRILVCPSDKERRRKIPDSFARLSTNNISYFVIVDAPLHFGMNQAPSRVLFGDRDIEGFAPRSFCRPAGVILPAFEPRSVRWLGKLHEHGGNLALNDASAQQANAIIAAELLSKSNSTCGLSHVAVP